MLRSGQLVLVLFLFPSCAWLSSPEDRLVKSYEQCASSFGAWADRVEELDKGDDIEALFEEILKQEVKSTRVSWNAATEVRLSSEALPERDREDRWDDLQDRMKGPYRDCDKAAEDFQEELDDNERACEAYVEWAEDKIESWEDLIDEQEDAVESCRREVTHEEYSLLSRGDRDWDDDKYWDSSDCTYDPFSSAFWFLVPPPERMLWERDYKEDRWFLADKAKIKEFGSDQPDRIEVDSESCE